MPISRSALAEIYRELPVAQGVTSVLPRAWNRLAKALPYSVCGANIIGDKLHKGANVLTSGSADDFYRQLISHCNDPASVVIGGLEPATLLTGDAPDMPWLDQNQRMMAMDTLTYLPDCILVKVDKAAMGVSLESLVPLLDHRVVEFAAINESA